MKCVDVSRVCACIFSSMKFYNVFEKGTLILINKLPPRPVFGLKKNYLVS